MIGIDRYGLQIPLGLADNRKNSRQAAQPEVPSQTPAPAGAGGPEMAVSPTMKLSGVLWAIRSEATEARGTSPEEEFSRMSQMTLAERIRAKILEEHDLTEADLAGLPEEQLKAIEDEIAQAIKQAYGIEDESGTETGQHPSNPLSL
jgi:hypothetical protein